MPRPPLVMSAAAVMLGVVLAAAGCAPDDEPAGPGDESPDVRGAEPAATLDVPVPQGRLVAVLADGAVAVLAADGTVEQRMGSVPQNAGEAVSIDLSVDRRTILVGALDHRGVSCRPMTYQVGSDGTFTVVAAGTGAAYSPDGRKIAYRRYRWERGYCLEEALVLRGVATDEEIVWDLPGEDPVMGTPPSWPINWSPDGTRVALVRDRSVLVLAVDDLTHSLVTASADAEGFVSADAPVFLDVQRLAVLGGCCVGDLPVESIELASGAREVLFDAPAPIRSIRRDREGAGLWFTVEEAGLWRWDGRGTPRAVGGDAEKALLVSGY